MLFGEARRQYQGPAESHTILTLGRWGSGHDCMQTSHNSMQQVYASHKPQLYTTHHSRAECQSCCGAPPLHNGKWTHCKNNILLKGQARSTAQAQKKHQVCTSGNSSCVQQKLVKGKRYTSSNQTQPSKSMQRSTPHATPTLSLLTPQHILSCNGLRCGDTTVGRWTNAQADGQQSAIHQQSSRDAHTPACNSTTQAKLEHNTPNSCCCVPLGRYTRS